MKTPFFPVRSGKSKEKNFKSVTKETALTSEPLQWTPDRALWYPQLFSPFSSFGNALKFTLRAVFKSFLRVS